ncbi:uncharacterized protein LOC116614309 [Nematostella vectensis]|uniref:uncharacterized protein LOC116614309 n=1 Tax=Nematostella vectensis TaxID=45351 RepID=UPI002077949B|nr:uncharacterized protein LOC116614309 [Nematostella vectensis]
MARELILGVYLFTIIAKMVALIRSCEATPNSRGNTFVPHFQSRLTLSLSQNRTMLKQWSKGDDSCIYACLRMPWCISVNVNVTALKSGIKEGSVCELFDITFDTEWASLEKDANFTHYSVKISGATPCEACEPRNRHLNVSVISEGYDDPAKNSNNGLARIFVDGKDYSLNKRGHNIVAFSTNGSFISRAAFDSHPSSSTAPIEMAAYIESLPSNTVIIIAVKDTAGSTGAAAHQAIQSIGGVSPLWPEYRASWWMVGHKGGPRTWVSQGGADRYKGPSKGQVMVPLEEGCAP